MRELVPQDLQALRDVNVLQDETGVSGEIDVTVRADDITDPKVIAWMTSFQNRVLRDARLQGRASAAPRSGTRPSCAPRCRCPTCSARPTGQAAGAARCSTRCRRYFSQGVVTADRTTANLAFGIRLMPLDRQKQVVDDIKRRAEAARRA